MLLRQSFHPKSVLICTAALLLGLGLLFRSLSRQCARADRLEELDERNLLIQLRSKGLAFTIVQNALLVLCLLSAAGGVLRSGQPGGPAGIRRDAGPVRAALVPIILGGTALRDPL